jgi:ketosteroid isomerase-like protein
MKKLITIGLIAISSAAFSQGIVKNGTILKEHPYITAVEQLAALYPKADTLAIAGFYADTVTFYDAPEPKHPYKLAEAKKGWTRLFAEWEQITIKKVGYPDALEYSSDPFTVQSWWSVTAVNKKTKKTAAFEEVIFDTFNKNGKITSELSYYDTKSLMDAEK